MSLSSKGPSLTNLSKVASPSSILWTYLILLQSLLPDCVCALEHTYNVYWLCPAQTFQFKQSTDSVLFTTVATLYAHSRSSKIFVSEWIMIIIFSFVEKVMPKTLPVFRKAFKWMHTPLIIRASHTGVDGRWSKMYIIQGSITTTEGTGLLCLLCSLPHPSFLGYSLIISINSYCVPLSQRVV